MGGVDRMDQYRSYYSVGRKSMKYWKYILFSLFNIGIINSYIVYKKNNANIPNRYNLLTFKDALCEEMMKHYKSRVLPPKLYIEMYIYIFYVFSSLKKIIIIIIIIN